MTWRLVGRWRVDAASGWPVGGFSVCGPPLHLGDGDQLVVRVRDAEGRTRHTGFRRVVHLSDARLVRGVELSVCPDWCFPVTVRLLHGAGAQPRSTI